jgi:hypothetical protein
MSSRAGVRLGGLGLALGVCFVAIHDGRGDDEDEAKATKEAQQAVLKMMDTMRGGGDGAAQAKAIHDKFADLKVVMNIFKPSSKGGLGVGPKAKGDGIEQRIITWSRSPGDLNRSRPAMERAAEVSRAMAVVADLYPPKKDAAKWKKYCDEMRQAADELMKSARGTDAKAVKNAAMNLNGSCTSCHGDFRDN